MARRKGSTDKRTEVTVDPREIEAAVHFVRGHRVMIDADLARLYGVTTSALNQAVKRNLERFPEDFMFQMTPAEFEDWKSQIVISNPGAKMALRKRPNAFTEHGVAMLSSVLNSPTAARVNIEIMRTFVRLRRLMATPGELVEQLNRLAETVQTHDGQIKQIVHVLEHMLAEPEEPKRRIGFHASQNEGAE